jgi:hypothetical protein
MIAVPVLTIMPLPALAAGVSATGLEPSGALSGTSGIESFEEWNREFAGRFKARLDKTLDRLQVLEEKEAVAEEAKGKPAPVPSSTAPAPIRFSALGQVWYNQSLQPGKQGGFKVRRAELKAEGSPAPRVNWRLLVDPAMAKEDDVTYTPAGTSPRAVTSVGRKSILMDLALSYDLPVPAFSRVTVGQFKPPFGMEGMGGSDVLDLLDRSLMTMKLKWAGQRDLGAQAQVKLGTLDFAAGVFNGEGWNVDTDTNPHRNVNVRAVWKPAGFLAVGAAYQGGRTAATEDLNEHTGVELDLDLKSVAPIRVRGEYALGVRGPRGRAWTVRTGYGTVVIGVVPGIIELVGRFDWEDGFDLAPPSPPAPAPAKYRPNDWLTEATVGVNWKLAGDRAKLQVNYLREDEPTPKVKNDIIRAGFQVVY